MTYLVIALFANLAGTNLHFILVVKPTTPSLGHVLSVLFRVTFSWISAVLTIPVPLCVVM